MLALESCKPQELLCGLKLKTARTALRLDIWTTRTSLRLDTWTARTLFVVAALKRCNTPLLIGRYSRNKIVLMFTFFTDERSSGNSEFSFGCYLTNHEKFWDHIFWRMNIAFLSTKSFKEYRLTGTDMCPPTRKCYYELFKNGRSPFERLSLPVVEKNIHLCELLRLSVSKKDIKPFEWLAAVLEKANG